MMKSQFRRTRTSMAAGAVLLAGAVLTQGCLQREVKKQNPTTSNIFVEPINNAAINEIDLLFVIDNSVSMADKQEILVRAVPQMVERLVNPSCVDEAGNTSPNTGTCPAGSAPEFRPVDDIHIGVITSSLGGHGAPNICVRGEANKYNDDQGHLIPSVRPGLADTSPTGNGGFLTWNGAQPGEDRNALINTLVSNFADHVAAADENGCGFEAPLEAWYRFLVDPQPPVDIVLVDQRSTMMTDAEGNPLVDGVVLQQREAFLRPTSLVAIVVLTDENDCSVMDGGSYYNNATRGYLVVHPNYDMPIATNACDVNPNDKCCISCSQKDNAPAGCSVAECDGSTIPDPDNRLNVRCFENKRRFGVDLLYPTQRYLDALKSTEIIDARNGSRVPNPLLMGAGIHAGTPRDPQLVFFAGIVGVPWQDVATDASLASETVMEYRTAAQLLNDTVDFNGASYNRWDVILGRPGIPMSAKVCEGSDAPTACGQFPSPPLDPFMIESPYPRTAGAANPISGDIIVDYNNNSPTANNINGHEVNHQVPSSDGPANDDLQYACIFPLETPKTDCVADDYSCDCGSEPLRNSPLCQPPAGGPAAPTQYFGKAYPGTRVLELLRDFGNNSIVGSICPKNALAADVSGDVSDPNYGYNPAVQAIVDRLAEKLAGKCLPRELTLDETGSVPCEVVEAAPAVGPNGVGTVLNCNDPGRDEVPELVRPAVLKYLEAEGICGSQSGKSCNDYQMCSITELSVGEPGRPDCLTNSADPAGFPEAGFCYIDPALEDEDGQPIAGGVAANEIVKNCPASQRRLLRFVGANTPAPNTFIFVACTADAASSDAPIPAPPTPGVEETP